MLYYKQKELIHMKTLEKLNNNKEVIKPQSMEQKIGEAIKDFESGKTYSAKEVKKSLSKKYGIEL